MICATCEGPVEWQGPLSNLTHTLCLRCGAVNNQVVDPPETLNRCMECGAEIPDNQTWCGHCQNFDEISGE